MKSITQLVNLSTRKLVNLLYMKNLRSVKAENQHNKRSNRLKYDITRRLLDYLERKYEMRYNTALGCAEIRKAGSDEPFVPADERMRNTIAIKARLDGIDAWDKDIRRYTESGFVKVFNPVDDFLKRLQGRWGGKNHIEALADCVPNDNARWAEWFHTWFLAMVAQWMGLDNAHGNSVAPLLISQQGYRKSTFCKRLLPEVLQWGYNDNLIMSEKQNTLRAMTQSLLINIDEFNALSAKTQDGFLKNVMQLASIKLRQPYRQQQLTLPRVASFIATANVSDVFSDPSGCRRFIAVTLTGPIRLPDRIDYEQLYAQAVAELEAGRCYWFDEADTQEIMANNQHYQQRTPAEALFLDCFSIPKDLTKGVYMTAASIFSLLRQRYGSQLNLTSLSHFGRVLANIPNLHSKHSSHGTEYLVAVRRNAAQSGQSSLSC
ncbi:Virulence-associated protein E [Prevotella jejuni]|uniref:Virulence-associated protein E n=2 Tax=Prevotella jejuni TaxID=1177574 RepID=A0AA94LL60_9BACT|nr:Virulence-associated protein E [Prevotella jejuni]